MRISSALLLAALVGGCTSVKVVKREQCWVRQTARWPGQVTEELGPCERAAPQWAEDRLTRLVQECMAQADYRWQGRALAAWSQGGPPPEQEPEEVLRACMGEAARTLVPRQEALETRLGELLAEREALRASMKKDQEHLRASHAQLTGALGEAAKKPAPAAVATATAHGDGNATTRNDTSSRTAHEARLSSEGSAVAPPTPGRARTRPKAIPAPQPTVCEPAPQPEVPRAEPVSSPVQPVPALDTGGAAPRLE